jgi:hypothetical protein
MNASPALAAYMEVRFAHGGLVRVPVVRDYLFPGSVDLRIESVVVLEGYSLVSAVLGVLAYAEYLADVQSTLPRFAQQHSRWLIR